jgi:hypothetical protein
VSENSITTSHETRCISVVKTNWLMLLREIVTVYFKSQNFINATHWQVSEFFVIKARGIQVTQ